MGKCQNYMHNRNVRSEDEKENRLPTIAIDYMFFHGTKEEEAEGGKPSPILVMKGLRSKAIFAHAVSRKGTSDRWVVRKIYSLLTK